MSGLVNDLVSFNSLGQLSLDPLTLAPAGVQDMDYDTMSIEGFRGGRRGSRRGRSYHGGNRSRPRKGGRGGRRGRKGGRYRHSRCSGSGCGHHYHGGGYGWYDAPWYDDWGPYYDPYFDMYATQYYSDPLVYGFPLLPASNYNVLLEQPQMALGGQIAPQQVPAEEGFKLELNNSTLLYGILFVVIVILLLLIQKHR